MPQAEERRNSVPGRWEQYYGRENGKEMRRRAKESITKLLNAVNPALFSSADVEIRFCFRNHAKIVVCDDRIAYVGSANFSTASQNNFEAGYATTEADDIRQIRGFIAELRRESIAYSAIASSYDLRCLFEFAANVPSLIETFEWETKRWSMNYHTDELEPSFSEEKFGMSDDVEHEIITATESAERIELKWNADSSTLDERAFVEMNIPQQLRELRDSAEALRKRVALRHRSESDILSDFAGRCMDDSDTIQASYEFQDAVRAEQEHALERAKEASADFIQQMKAMQTAITGAFASIPKADNTGV